MEMNKQINKMKQNGKKYYFCCSLCKDKFEEDPHEYKKM
ncbi:MAG: YHS domain-containing protein [Promethearchaeota archaeon]|jgi:YHS domain-containing protein